MASLCHIHDGSRTTVAPGEPDSHLFSGLEARAQHDHDKVAIVYHDQRVTYGDLHRAALCLAGYLQQHLGVRRGDRVLVAMPDSPQFAVAWYGVLRCDAIVVTTPTATPHVIAGCVRTIGARVAIATDACIASLTTLLDTERLHGCVVAAPTGEPVGNARRTGMHDLSEALAAGIGPVPMLAAGRDPAVMACVPGGPGRPRVATLSHRAFALMASQTTRHRADRANRIDEEAAWLSHLAGMRGLSQAIARGEPMALPLPHQL